MFLLTTLFQLFLLSGRDIDVDPFFGHLSYPFLTSTDIVVYNCSISERREQGLCWSTSTNLMAIRSNMQPSKKRYALCNSSATNAYVCGWMENMSPKTTCRPTVLCWQKHIPLPADSTPKLVKPVPTVRILPSPGSTRIAAKRSLERRGIRSFSTITEVWSTRRLVGSLTMMAVISPSPMAVE